MKRVTLFISAMITNVKEVLAICGTLSDLLSVISWELKPTLPSPEMMTCCTC